MSIDEADSFLFPEKKTNHLNFTKKSMSIDIHKQYAVIVLFYFLTNQTNSSHWLITICENGVQSSIRGKFEQILEKYTKNRQRSDISEKSVGLVIIVNSNEKKIELMDDR